MLSPLHLADSPGFSTLRHQVFFVPTRHEIPYPICARTGDCIIVEPGHPTAPLTVIRRLPILRMPRAWRKHLLDTGNGQWRLPEHVRPPELIGARTDRTGVVYVVERPKMFLHIMHLVRHGYYPAALSHLDYLFSFEPDDDQHQDSELDLPTPVYAGLRPPARAVQRHRAFRRPALSVLPVLLTLAMTALG